MELIRGMRELQAYTKKSYHFLQTSIRVRNFPKSTYQREGSYLINVWNAKEVDEWMQANQDALNNRGTAAQRWMLR